MFLELDQTRIFYETFGSGHPLLCLPAFPFDHRIFEGQRMLQDQVRLILPDYPGTGRSSLLRQPLSETVGDPESSRLLEGARFSMPMQPFAYTMDQLAQVCWQLLDSLGIRRFAVMGISMGAYVAFSMLAAAPDRITGVILADTRADADTSQAFAKRRETIVGLSEQGSAFMVPRVAGLFSGHTKERRPEIVKLAEAQLADHDAAGLAQITAGLAVRPDRTVLLPRLASPCLVLCGEEDAVSPPESMQAMAAKIPGAEFHRIPDAGHLSPWEQPERVNSLIKNFLNR